jgi:hypothetical protein
MHESQRWFVFIISKVIIHTAQEEKANIFYQRRASFSRRQQWSEHWDRI